jgi:hypothetical protein
MRLLAVLVLLTACETGTPREDWQRTWRALMMVELCNDGATFRVCFGATTGPACREALGKTLDDCLATEGKDLPARLSISEGTRWGEKLGKCAGAGYFEAMKDRHELTPACSAKMQQ